MICYHSFLLMDHEERMSCLYEFGRFVTAGSGPLSIQAYFVLNDFFVSVQLDQERLEVMDTRPLRHASECSFMYYLLEEDRPSQLDTGAARINNHFHHWGRHQDPMN